MVRLPGSWSFHRVLGTGHVLSKRPATHMLACVMHPACGAPSLLQPCPSPSSTAASTQQPVVPGCGEASYRHVVTNHQGLTLCGVIVALQRAASTEVHASSCLCCRAAMLVVSAIPVEFRKHMRCACKPPAAPLRQDPPRCDVLYMTATIPCSQSHGRTPPILQVHCLS